MRNSSKNGSEIRLVDYAERAGISVYYGKIPLCESMSLYSGGNYYIAIDLFAVRSMADGAVKTAHELGHCETGSFYNKYSPADVRSRHEYRADKWAAHALIKPDELKAAMENGCTEWWQLAEHFGVTEEFLRRAVYIYQREGLLVE